MLDNLIGIVLGVMLSAGVAFALYHYHILAISHAALTATVTGLEKRITAVETKVIVPLASVIAAVTKP